MIVRQSTAVDLFSLLPPVLRRMDPVLQQLDGILDDEAIVAAVLADWCSRSPGSVRRGRPTVPLDTLLRLLVVRRLYDWSYQETVRWVDDSMSLRQFCRLGCDPVPDASTLDRWACCLRPATLAVINARLVRLAGAQGITRGRKLRLDTTVVETTIHPPSDSALLADGVRVLSRLLRQARPLVTGPASLFRERVRSARRQARAIGESTRKRGEVGALLRQQAYRRLLAIARAMVRQSRQVAERLPVPAGARLRGALDATATLTEQVIDQTRRRLAGESVPADEKVVSLVEPHTAILRRDKPLRQTEFGHKVLLGEVEGGIIAQVQVLTGNAADSAQLLPSVAAHQAQFGRAPDLCATDRGFWSAGCEEAARRAGVKRVAIPQSGGRVSAARRQQERSRSFRRAQRFRAGGEGRISVCKRRGHLGRCRDHGADGFQRWIGWGVLANNLRVIADHAAAHQP